MFGLSVDERGDDIAEGGQGQVDLRRLLQTVAGRLGFGLSLRSGQVDQIQFPLPDVLLAVGCGG